MDFQIIIAITIVVITAVLLIIDVIRIDIVAILCLLALGLTGLLSPLETLSGFASNAVISIVAVMIMGKGISRTGMMDYFSQMVLKIAGNSPSRIVAVISSAAGSVGAFIHNIGAAVLFLPPVLNIARRQKIPASRLIMPVGYAVIISGTMTMVGSSPLILVNDFLTGASLNPYGLFAVTPVGLAILISGIVYFFICGRFILPRRQTHDDRESLQQKIIHDWQLSSDIWHYRIPAHSPIKGKTLEQTGVWDKYAINVLAVTREKSLEYAPWRETVFEPHQEIALLGQKEPVRQFALDYHLEKVDKPDRLKTLGDPTSAGFAEIIVPPRSAIAGKSIRKFGLRRRYGVEPLILYHGGEKVQGDFSDRVIASGDIFIVYGLWEKILELKRSNDFLLVTPVEVEEKQRSKIWIALGCFALAIALNIAGLPTSISFLSGVVVMVLAGVIDINEAYQSVDWRVVFFLAGLIPLGLAMQKTGAAATLAEQVMSLVRYGHPVLLLVVISLVTAVFSLFISNVGAMVVMSPLVINMAKISGLDPRPLVLLVAVSAANSFILPTHQVNALLKTPGGYINSDYLKAGAGMTVIFLAVTVAIFYFFYL